jgi:hypothetical protein
VIPLFPVLHEYLDKAYTDAPDETVHIIRNARNSNHRTRLEKIIKRAGLSPWPKLFQNLRASRATELAGEFPAHVAAEWLGHSTMIAQRHYWQTTDADFEKATSALHKAKHTGAQSMVMEGKDRSENCDNSAAIADLVCIPVGDEGLES